MRTAIVSCFLFAVLAPTGFQAPAVSSQSEPSVEIFWTKFKTAVIKNDKRGAAALSQFPIDMPYGFIPVRNTAQLIKRYGQVFNDEASAVKCFAHANPAIDSAHRNRFTVGCKNSAGDEVIIYGFSRTKAGWKFKSLDNINE